MRFKLPLDDSAREATKYFYFSWHKTPIRNRYVSLSYRTQWLSRERGLTSVKTRLRRMHFLPVSVSKGHPMTAVSNPLCRFNGAPRGGAVFIFLAFIDASMVPQCSCARFSLSCQSSWIRALGRRCRIALMDWSTPIYSQNHQNDHSLPFSGTAFLPQGLKGITYFNSGPPPLPDLIESFHCWGSIIRSPIDQYRPSFLAHTITRL